jgi:hypothetical protein
MVVSTPQIQTTTLRHVGNSLIHVLKGVRFSMLYAAIGVFIAAAWLATQIGRGTIVQSNTSNNATGTGQTLQMQPNQAEGGQVHMDVTTPNVSNNSNTSIHLTPLMVGAFTFTRIHFSRPTNLKDVVIHGQSRMTNRA